MQFSLRYGASSTLELDLPGDSLLAHCDVPRGAPLAEPRRAVAQALAEPLAMPPLSQCLAPGDRVALALDVGVPGAPMLVAATLEVLLAHGVSPAAVTIVQTANDGDEDPRELLSPACRADVRVVVHDASTRDELCFLGRAKSDRLLYVNRAVGDADFVLPIGCLRPRLSASYLGIPGGIFPAFADAPAMQRARSPQKGETHRAAFARVRREAWQAVRMLGVTFALQVVPGAGDAWLHVLAGDVAAVESRGRALSREAWLFSPPERASLVVATIEGPRQLQTWRALGRALRVACGAMTDGGALLLCCDVAGEPGPGVEFLARSEDPFEALRHLSKEKTWPDRAAAADIARAATRARVFLLSGLDPTLVEDLGMAPVASAAEAARLVARRPPCTLLANAHLSAAGAPANA